MKHIVLIILLCVVFIAPAQQPRLPVVDAYLEETGGVVAGERPDSVWVSFLEKTYGRTGLLLNFPEVDDRGTKELIPFGFRLSEWSEIPLVPVHDNLCQSGRLPLFNRSMFSSVRYMLCDSTDYGVSLLGGEHWDRARFIARLKAYFKYADMESDTVSLFSDCDYLVKVGRNEVEAYALLHYPGVAVSYPGVKLYGWNAPQRIDIDAHHVDLKFYVQETKENNLQIAFRCHVSDANGAERTVKEVCLSNGRVRVACQVQSEERVFLMPNQVKDLVEDNPVHLLIVFDNGQTITCQMSYAQFMSLKMTYEYFRWNVTNYKVKYKNW